MKRRLFLALVTSVAVIATAPAWARDALPKASPEQVGMSAQRLARISDVLKQEIEQGKLPGAVVMVARKGKLSSTREAIGFQDKETGQPMAMDSVFRIYSMTKPLVSVAAMMLVEDGKIQLTDPVSKFLPPMKDVQVSVPKADPVFARVPTPRCRADREMTVQDLLRHTSGLAYGEITQQRTGARMPTPRRAYSSRGARLRFARHDAGRAGRAPVQGAARASAGHGVGIQPRVRHAGTRGRGGERQATVGLSRRAPVQAAEDGRHRFLAGEGQDRRAWRSRWRPIRRRASRTS